MLHYTREKKRKISNNLLDLPVHLIIKIIRYLDDPEWANLQIVNKFFKNIVSETDAQERKKISEGCHHHKKWCGKLCFSEKYQIFTCDNCKRFRLHTFNTNCIICTRFGSWHSRSSHCIGSPVNNTLCMDYNNYCKIGHIYSDYFSTTSFGDIKKRSHTHKMMKQYFPDIKKEIKKKSQINKTYLS